MKNLVNTLIALATLASLAACEVKEQNLKDYSTWNRSTIGDRKIDGKTVPTSYIFDCRHVTDAKNVHYYYSLIADPTGVVSQNDDGEKVTSYKQASLEIEVTTVNSADSQGASTNYNKGVLSADVDFHIVQSGRSVADAYVVANNETVKTLRAFYKNNPHFNNVKVGDVLMHMQSNPFSRHSKNLTPQDLPGITNGDDLECR